MCDIICDVITCCVSSCDMGKINVYDEIMIVQIVLITLIMQPDRDGPLHENFKVS